MGIICNLVVHHVLAFLFVGFCHAEVLFSVRSYGAKADGVTDDSTAFLKAWKDACSSSSSSVISVPQGSYLVAPVYFKGPCKNSIYVQFDGIIKAPAHSMNGCGDSWFEFRDVASLTVQGHGVFYGNGASWWHKKSQSCEGATSLRFTGTTNTIVKEITSINSQQMHIVFDRCQHVKAHDVTVKAPADSPNTDGIHVGHSSDVSIANVIIATGDDCISIGTGTYDVFITGVHCGSGHGISVGSLGQDSMVRNITVSGATLQGTENGLRIKTWKGGSGTASHITFQNVEMKSVKNPIIIDQNYCPSHSTCVVGSSGGVHISDVLYKKITGTCAGGNSAIVFNCSSTAPCEGITVVDVDITPATGGQPASVCQHAQGQVFGIVRPHSCLGH